MVGRGGNGAARRECCGAAGTMQVWARPHGRPSALAQGRCRFACPSCNCLCLQCHCRWTKQNCTWFSMTPAPSRSTAPRRATRSACPSIQGCRAAGGAPGGHTRSVTLPASSSSPVGTSSVMQGPACTSAGQSERCRGLPSIAGKGQRARAQGRVSGVGACPPLQARASVHGRRAESAVSGPALHCRQGP
eukprot:361874-Chlamydomonas_euryale.AAC.1